jgi:hypothetical protein
MPSTYTLNNGIELIATGEQSGTWGDTTNVNLELIDTALDGQVTITLPAAGSSGSPNALAISDGSASNGRNRLIIFTDGGDLGATAFVQLTPNDAEKIVYIRNSLTGGRALTLFQGTYNASNDYEVPAGTTAVVFFNGGGSGAIAANVFNNAYFDSLRLGSVSVTAILDEDNMASNSATALATQQSIKAYVDAQVGANNELSEVLANGNTSGANNIQMTTTAEVQFRDTALKINSSADGQLDIDADVELELTAPTLDINASTAVTIDTATLTMTGSVNVVGDLDVDNLNLNGNAIISTNTNGNIDLTPNGTGEVNISKVDIDGGTIDGTVIGGSSAAAGTFTTATATTGNITTVNATTVDTTNIEVTTIKAKDGTSAGSIADSTGVVTLASSVLTTTDINGGTVDGAVIGGSSAAAITGTTITATGDVTIADKIVHSGDTNTAIRFPAADTVTIETAGVERLRISSTGDLIYDTDALVVDAANDRVGINTTTPATTLDVGGSIYASSIIRNTGGGSAATPSIQPGNDADTGMFWPGTNTIGFSTAGSERMRIDSSGNVGIGTSAPDAKLDVSAGTGSGATGVAGLNTLTVQNSGAAGIAILTTNSVFGSIAFGDPENGAIGRIRYNHSDDSMLFQTNAAERMRITSAGNVGIGTTSPTADLSVGSITTSSGDVHLRTSKTAVELTPSNSDAGGMDINVGFVAGGQGPLKFSIGGTERMRIDSSGNLGLGVTPSAWGSAVKVAQVSNASIAGQSNQALFSNNAFFDGAGWKYISSSPASQYYLDINAQHQWLTAPSGTAGNAITFTQAMTLDASGNLLVGTTSGTEKLTILTGGNKTAISGYLNAASSTSTPVLYMAKYDNDNTTSQVYVRFAYNQNTFTGGQINGNGANQAAFGSWSDLRLKDNVENLPPQLANIMALRPVEFDYKAGGHQVGFIAQEMQEVYPDAVGNDGSEDEYLTITGWDKTTARLVKAIQELKAEVDSLRAQLNP